MKTRTSGWECKVEAFSRSCVLQQIFISKQHIAEWSLYTVYGKDDAYAENVDFFFLDFGQWHSRWSTVSLDFKTQFAFWRIIKSIQKSIWASLQMPLHKKSDLWRLWSPNMGCYVASGQLISGCPSNCPKATLAILFKSSAGPIPIKSQRSKTNAVSFSLHFDTE